MICEHAFLCCHTLQHGDSEVTEPGQSNSMEFVKPPEAFAFEEPNAPQRWARWLKQFETYFVAAELSTKSQEVQVARLLNAAGPEAQEIHELFTYEAEDDKKDYKKVLKKFSEYCRPRKNVIAERYRY